jgi:hypothetical protein
VLGEMLVLDMPALVWVEGEDGHSDTGFYPIGLFPYIGTTSVCSFDSYIDLGSVP